MQKSVAEDGYFEDPQANQQNNTARLPLQDSYHQDTLQLSIHSIEDENDTTETNGAEPPPAKRRKTVVQEAGKQRAFSPPWKKIQVEGPSTFHEDGVRKSARTNYVPIDLQPQSDKRKTRGAVQHGRVPAIVSKYGGSGSTASQSDTSVSSHKQNGDRKHLSNGNRRLSQGTSMSANPDKTKRRDHGTESNPTVLSQTDLKLPKHGSVRQTTMSTQDQPQKRKVGRPRRSSVSKRPDATPSADTDTKGRSVFGFNAESTPHHRPSSAQKPQRLNLRFNSAAVGVHSIGNVVRRQEIEEGGVKRPKYSSFADWAHQEATFEMEEKDKKLRRIDLRMTEAAIQVEATLRRELSQAAAQNGLLSRDHCTYWHKDEKPREPEQKYTHQDRLLVHMHKFHSLMIQEKKRHLRIARECAHQAAAFVRAREEKAFLEWKKDQPKTAEELAREQAESCRSTYAQIVEDMKRKWLMVTQIVADVRLQRWQTEQDRLGKEALNEAIEKSKGLLHQRRRRSTISGNSDDDTSSSDSRSARSSSASEVESNHESNMSSSESESEAEGSLPNSDDEGLTQEQLRKKYQLTELEVTEDFTHRSTSPGSDGQPSIAALMSNSEHGSEHGSNAAIDSLAPLEEVDAALLDDSEEDTDMSDDMGTSEDDVSRETSSDDQESGEDDGFGALGRFFTKAQRRDMEKDTMDTSRQSQAGASRDHSFDFEGTDDEADKVSLIPDIVQGPTPSASNSEEPQTLIPRGDSNDSSHVHDSDSDGEPQNNGMAEIIEDVVMRSPQRPTFNIQAEESELPATPVSTQALKTAVPSLLRGTLREYQHYGLDWLAGLYSADNNGILADEMGLGKTIQTIALLAHLAEHHEAWGPHLIVVPTSVMLNWEVEFKKFLPGFKVLTYYGTQEERKRKRAGWMDNDKWNVWITSYTLITQDQLIFRRKAWHYMILDEAHNIKNFQSLRWQTLLTFRTRARLLLTGTPLQNNLTELWSLLYFLMPSDNSGNGIAGFTNLDEFSGWFKKPTEQILEQGREALDEDARKAVRKLHDILRPYLLRRLKADVEKQMPLKYEHVVYCRLSKRQRYLYDGFMSRAQTRETLASGNTFSIMNALMQLRKVCNHPDLFETRQIVTSFAMPKSAIADYEIKELMVRRRLLREDPMTQVDLNLINLMPGANEQMSALDSIQTQRLGALGAFRHLTNQQGKRVKWNMTFDGSSIQHTLDHFDNNACRLRFDKLHQMSYLTSLRSQRRPLFSYSLMDRLRFGVKTLPYQDMPSRRDQQIDWYTKSSPALRDMVLGIEERSSALKTTIEKFTCATPAAVATDMVSMTLGSKAIEVLQEAKTLCSQDPFHQSRVRQSIAFPDKRLLQYDCGKLQKLDGLLRKLQSGGHRALIFTQMTRVLDILEQFMSIHGHRYLRLDGATKLEQRQMLTERFNNDNRILAFILSSRSGGIGINLTGADTVIFYDLDWNPAMDKQCQDRCHRIGQTRDVHIYRLVSEHTIEANILRKANQKRMLDDVVIQDGDFTTDFFNKADKKDDVEHEAGLEDTDEAANAAMDKVFGNRGPGKILEAVEDQDDAKAAKEAEKEIVSYDAADFDEKQEDSANASSPKANGPGEDVPPPALRHVRSTSDVEMTTTMEAAESGLAVPGTSQGDELVPSCDDYMIKFLDWELQDVPVQPPAGKKKKRKVREILGRRR